MIMLLLREIQRLNPRRSYYGQLTLAGATLSTLLLCTWPTGVQAAAGDTVQNRPAQTLCRPSVAWHVGTVDPRFGVTAQAVARAAERATAMWNQAAGRPLFEQVEQQGIAVSLTYDHRQAFFEEASLMYQQLADIRNDIAEYDEELSEHLAEVDALTGQIDVHNTRIRSLSAQANQLVEANRDRRGRVPVAIAREVDALRSELADVNNDAQALVKAHNRIQQAYNANVAERNLLAQQHSELAQRLNQRIAQQPGATDVGEHGIFMRTAGDRVQVEQEFIRVYQVRSEQGLVTVLAHEFGHAIGIGHVSEADAIMAARIESQLTDGFPQRLSGADIAALDAVCE